MQLKYPGKETKVSIGLVRRPAICCNFLYHIRPHTVRKSFSRALYRVPIESDVHVTVHGDKFLIIKPTRCTNFSNLFLK